MTETVDQIPSPGTRIARPLGTLMARWALCSAALWLVFSLLLLQAEGLWPWGLLQGFVGLLYSLVEGFTGWAAPLASRVVQPADSQNPAFGYWAVRFLFSAAFYGVPVAIGWQLFARERAVRAAKAAAGSSRRSFVGKMGLAAIAAAGGGSAFWVSVVVPSRVRVRRYEIPIFGLPRTLDGLKLAHLSDTHYGPYVSRGHILHAIECANAEAPDIAVLTGDYVHRTPRAIDPGIGLFADLHPRLGTVAVLGNHDHWEDADACRARFVDLDIPLLENARLFATADGLTEHEVPDRSVAIVGMADYTEARPAPRVASRRISPLCPRIMLSHHPDVAERFAQNHPDLRFDLQLSGHTHGGQVRLPGLGTPVVPSNWGTKYAGGLVQGPAWPVVVSRGVGMAVAPIRLGVAPEIGIITLRSA